LLKAKKRKEISQHNFARLPSGPVSTVENKRIRRDKYSKKASWLAAFAHNTPNAGGWLTAGAIAKDL
jgi:hypothetical protein